MERGSAASGGAGCQSTPQENEPPRASHGDTTSVPRILESYRVETALTKEQSLVLNTDKYANDRQQRLDYLSQLRTTLSAANIGLSTVRYVVPADKQPIAYDVIQEVYGTIKWNIPLGPSDATTNSVDSTSAAPTRGLCPCFAVSTMRVESY